VNSAGEGELAALPGIGTPNGSSRNGAPAEGFSRWTS
jgi:hypothetical protein